MAYLFNSINIIYIVSSILSLFHSFALLLINAHRHCPSPYGQVILVLLADKLVNDFGAALAFDIAAPVEFAVAALHDLGLVLVVTTAAAHQLASIHPL